MQSRLKPGTLNRTRSLQPRADDAERKLWHMLRGLKSQGFHFKRQVPFRGYMLDFMEHSARLVVELDDAQHAADEVRDRILSSEGYRTLRVSHFDALKNPWRIAQSIVAELEDRRASPPI